MTADILLFWSYFAVFTLALLASFLFARFFLLASFTITKENYSMLYSVWLLAIAAAFLLSVAYLGELTGMETIHKGFELAALAVFICSAAFLGLVTNWSMGARSDRIARPPRKS